jgi:predicted nucleotidyltransferase component of viral defense system
LTQQDVLAHEAQVPWPEIVQVEQDLLLCLAMQAIFEDPFLKTQVAMRGGTVLHKLHLAPPARYSEDIDLVAVGERPEEHIRRALLRVLRPLFGREKSSVWDALKLTARNLARPSRILRCIYQVASVSSPGQTLTIEVETKVSERIPHQPLQRLPFEIPFRGERRRTELVSYNINEMLATKMRAMFQRRKGRDLFDLYWAITAQSATPVSVPDIIAGFEHYMRDEGSHVPRAEFSGHLRECLADRVGFCLEMGKLLRRDLAYDPLEAGSAVEAGLIAHLKE